VPATACLVNNVTDESGTTTVGYQEGPFVAHMASRALPCLQRTAKFDPPTVHPVWNEAEQVVNGGPAGRSWGVLNGTKLSSLADGAAAINRPDIGGQTTGTGSECWVNTVPSNVGSADSNILTNGPWSTVTTKATLGRIFGRNVCRNASPGSATLNIKGYPSDVETAARVQAHEAHHASDHRTAFNSTLLNWDIALTSAQSSAQVFNGADPLSCEAALFNAIGGSPDDAAAAWMNAYADAIVAFHATPEGKELNVKNLRGDPDCNGVTADAV
jgi:hypothetical protein